MFLWGCCWGAIHMLHILRSHQDAVLARWSFSSSLVEQICPGILRAIYIISFLLLRSDRNTSLMRFFSLIRELRCRFGPDQVSGPVPRNLLTSGVSFLWTKQIKKLWFWLQLHLFVAHISPSHSVTWLQH